MIQNSVSFRFPDAAYNLRMNSPVKFWPIRAYYNIDLARAKSEALGSQISIVYSNKMENRVMLSKEATKCQKKKSVGLISKITTLHVQHTFLYISLPFFFARLQQETSRNILVTRFMCSCPLFFSLPPIFTLVAASTSPCFSPPL